MRPIRLSRIAATLIGLHLATLVAAAEPQVIPVVPLKAAPTVDGTLSDWRGDGWHVIPIAPTVKPEERADLGLGSEDHNAVGESRVELQAGVHQGRFYVAVRWPDDAPNTDLDVWMWNGRRYSRARRFDDMLAMRFALAGDYDRSMLSGKNYEADLWEWSASRSQLAGFAEDFRQVVGTKIIENAAEYSVKGVGTIYIKKYRDAGNYPFKTVRPPKTQAEEQIVAVQLKGAPDGSYADVAASGSWAEGHWQLELARQLDTGHEDDVVLPAGGTITGQIAVFNHASDENKSVSEPLRFDFSAIPVK
ncbi:MAG: hypothetical protein KDH20_16745 [Rhodocyclaceae bacterium]|nr:hypothetical protein [Rhodocyclaceae bacterium]